MKVVAYLRVSTDRQAEHGFGLDVQEATIKAWAKANGHRIVSWYRDEGISGSNGLDTRIGLLDAFEALKANTAGGLVVARLDRLARDLILQEQLLAELHRIGAELFSTSTGEAGFLANDPDDPSRALIRQVLGAVAQYERSMIRLRTAAGRRRKGEQGGYAYGRPPFGSRVEGGELVDDPAEQETLSRMRELRAAGSSYRAIAETLNAEGRRAKQGDVWHNAQVRAILVRA